MSAFLSQSSHNPTVWIITEGIAGTENQCIGVAEKIGFPYEIKRIQLKQPWRTLSPYLGFENSYTFCPSLSPPWPDILITSGRKSVAAARYIKRRSPCKTFSVHIQNPKISSRNFDLVAVPRHDDYNGDNVIVTDASPNKITGEILERSKDSFDFSTHQSPRIAVLIGGKSNAYSMDKEMTETLARDISRLEGSLLITCSRRTGEENTHILKKTLDNGHNFFWDGTGDNPYFSMLAQADYILVTSDSASMISESCTTGKPVFMIPLEGGAKRINRLHSRLLSSGKMKLFNGIVEDYSYEPLNDAQMVADEIKKRFHAFTHAS